MGVWSVGVCSLPLKAREPTGAVSREEVTSFVQIQLADVSGEGEEGGQVVVREPTLAAMACDPEARRPKRRVVTTTKQGKLFSSVLRK